MTTIQQIIELLKVSDPENADVFTEEWVIRKCARLNESPEQRLADMLKSRANLENFEYKEFPADMPEWKKQQWREG